MLGDTVDLAGYDLVWRNKPELPVANAENKKIEETLKLKKIEAEKLKVILENNINKGKNVKEHFNDLCQTLNYKQQLYKSREHELEMEVHAEKILEREYSRMEQEVKAINREINSLKARQKQREYVMRLRKEEIALRRSIKEQTDLLSSEVSRNNALEYKINEKDRLATNLRNQIKVASESEKDLKAQLSIVRNVLSNVLYLKQVEENSLKQYEKQLSQKNERIQDLENSNKNLENKIENLSKETFEADHYTKELESILHNENDKNLKVQKEVDILSKDILMYDHEMSGLRRREKILETQNKDCQAEIRNLNARIFTIDQLRSKQESEMYEIESKLEKLRRRVKKMAGETNEEERRKIEKERSSLLAVLEEKKSSSTMLTEELKLMMDKITVAKNYFEANKKFNVELTEKIKFLDFYIMNSQKTLKCCVSRKQESLVQECLERFQMKKFQKLLNKKNRSVASLKKSKLELELMMKERIEELKHCNELLETEMRTEADECGVVKKKLFETSDKAMKLQAKYKIILGTLGISEHGESAEAELLIKAENEKRDLEFERDKLMSTLLKDDEELSALKNTLWLINTANDQFRQALHPAGVNPKEGELLKTTESESQTIAIQMHVKQKELKTLEENMKGKNEKLEQGQKFYSELQEELRHREMETEMLSKELSALSTKIKRASKNTSRLSLEVRNKSPHPGVEEDIRIHLLREVVRTVSDLLFSAVDSMPEIYSKIQDLYQEARLPLPSRIRSSLSFRSDSSLSGFSKLSSSQTNSASNGHSSRSETFTPSVVNLGL
ncbi:coiled-coil domain-containing protein 39 [Nephila pilipes]|uniref:Coiled-coil domain-containing protein 39 n=1 Tax=Nephila pilipes TaxID=299642 RepID=A0A8X6NYM2_NEPPI|nr:coiled-coil domain-containing protein 39 [Nephila pilipes]